jgi:hypothetical protein
MSVQTIKDLIDAGAEPVIIFEALCQQERYDVNEVAYLAGITAKLPPVVRNVPYAAQEGTNLTCTMGEWVGEPTSYAYQWQVDGVAGATGTPLAVTAADNGKVFTCIVSATNANGVTAAPPSNAVTVSGAVVMEAQAAHPHAPAKAKPNGDPKSDQGADHKAEQHGRMPSRHDEPKNKGHS